MAKDSNNIFAQIKSLACVVRFLLPVTFHSLNAPPLSLTTTLKWFYTEQRTFIRQAQANIEVKFTLCPPPPSHLYCSWWTHAENHYLTRVLFNGKLGFALFDTLVGGGEGCATRGWKRRGFRTEKPPSLLPAVRPRRVVAYLLRPPLQKLVTNRKLLSAMPFLALLPKGLPSYRWHKWCLWQYSRLFVSLSLSFSSVCFLIRTLSSSIPFFPLFGWETYERWTPRPCHWNFLVKKKKENSRSICKTVRFVWGCINSRLSKEWK